MVTSVQNVSQNTSDTAVNNNPSTASAEDQTKFQDLLKDNKKDKQGQGEQDQQSSGGQQTGLPRPAPALPTLSLDNAAAQAAAQAAQLAAAEVATTEVKVPGQEELNQQPSQLLNQLTEAQLTEAEKAMLTGTKLDTKDKHTTDVQVATQSDINLFNQSMQVIPQVQQLQTQVNTSAQVTTTTPQTDTTRMNNIISQIVENIQVAAKANNSGHIIHVQLNETALSGTQIVIDASNQQIAVSFIATTDSARQWLNLQKGQMLEVLEQRVTQNLSIAVVDPVTGIDQSAVTSTARRQS
jgi:uncharacterized protein (DUF2344 family)